MPCFRGRVTSSYRAPTRSTGPTPRIGPVEGSNLPRAHCWTRVPPGLALVVSDFLRGHEGHDLFACPVFGQDFASILLAPLPNSRAPRSSISSSAAYLGPLKATTGRAAFSCCHLLELAQGQDKTCGLLPPNSFRLRGSSWSLLPTYASLTSRRTYSLRMAHFWDAYMPATLDRTFAKRRKLGPRP